MTHARSPQIPSAPGREGRPIPPSESDPQTLTDRRRLAEHMGLPAACPHKGCRGGRTCCGPRGATAAYPGAVLPACLAEAFEALYAPVLRWRALTDAMDSAVARLDGMEAKAASAGHARR